jgi:hypothetical protein
MLMYQNANELDSGIKTLDFTVEYHFEMHVKVDRRPSIDGAIHLTDIY